MSSGEVPVKRRGPRVVVVGAGIAGVGAVGVLRAGGIDDVILLEARDRPGGRVETCVLENGFVELGAQFMHGKNEFYDIAEREGMLVEQDPDEDSQPDTPLQFRDFIFRTSDGKPVHPDTVLCNLQVLEDLQLSANEALRQGAAHDVNVSVGQFFRSQYQASRRLMKGSDDLKTAMFRWLEHWDCQDAGGTVDELSLPGNGQYVFYPGNGTRETKSGMEAVFQSLLKHSIPPECLRLNKPVKVIQWPKADVQGVDLVGDLAKFSILPDLSKYGVNNNLINRENLENAKLDRALCGNDKNIKQVAEAIKSSTSTTKELVVDYSGRTPKGTKPKEPVTSHVYDKADDIDVGRTKLDSGSNSAVRIECEDGDIYYADHVIVTSSVGFLAENPDFFQPQLPLRHQDAIRSMGFGNVAKIFMFWDREEWTAQEGRPSTSDEATSGWQRRILGSEVEGMIPLWLEGADAYLTSARYTKKMSNGRHWYQDVSFYQVIQSHDFCIVGWLGGEAAIVMESLPVSEVKDVLHELLTVFLNKPDLPAPSRLIRTEWYSNRFTRGAYSFLATGVPLELHEVMSHPLPSPQNPVVQLAGEACSKRYYSTAHGALESGQDAARAILRHHHMTSQQQPKLLPSLVSSKI